MNACCLCASRRRPIVSGFLYSRPQAMQQRDQPRATLVDDAEFAFDVGADLPCRTRQGARDPSDQSLLLRFGKLAGAAADLEARQAADPALAVNLMPVANRLVVQQQRLGDLDATPTLVEKQQRIGASRQ